MVCSMCCLWCVRVMRRSVTHSVCAVNYMRYSQSQARVLTCRTNLCVCVTLLLPPRYYCIPPNDTYVAPDGTFQKTADGIFSLPTGSANSLINYVNTGTTE